MKPSPRLVPATEGGRRARTSALILRYWLVGTTVVLCGLMVWAFAPVLVFMGLLAAALGLLSALMIKLARKLEAWRAGR